MVCPGDDIASIYSLSPNVKKTLASKPSATPTELRGTSSIEQRGRGHARWLAPVTSWLLLSGGHAGLGRQPSSLSWQEAVPQGRTCSLRWSSSGFYVFLAVSVRRCSARVVPSGECGCALDGEGQVGQSTNLFLYGSYHKKVGHHPLELLLMNSLGTSYFLTPLDILRTFLRSRTSS